jgi:hypothetical protein
MKCKAKKGAKERDWIRVYVTGWEGEGTNW